MLHAIHPCKTCPFRRELGDKCFSPEVLDETVGVNLRGQKHVHVCHQANGKSGAEQRMCVGFMRFVRANDIPNQALIIGTRLGVLKPELLSDKVPICETWEEVLDNHDRALGPQETSR
jgi:hypothetical protein